jgi:GNAT superfamily N-acetyltransferase
MEELNKTTLDTFIFSDLALARRLEATEAQSSRSFVEARARLFSESGAEWMEVGGTYAMYDGPTSPLTQTFGLGMERPLTDVEMERIETFFRQRGAPVYHEVSPLADPAVLNQLNERGYQPLEFTSVMFLSLRTRRVPAASIPQEVKVRLIRPGEEKLYGQLSAKGWSEYPELTDLIEDIGVVSANGTHARAFLAELDGQPIATGGLNLYGGVALLAGASTIPEARRKGAQRALLEGRLRYASEQGYDIAMLCASPGSDSQRNAERQGFRIAYTRVKWRLTRS